MQQHDFDEFAGLLADVYGLKGQPLTAGQQAMFFRALACYPLHEVRAGLDAHVRDPKRGQFLPMPADVIAQIQGIAADDGRPGAEEAWALALTGRDERASVVWTREIAEAWGVASTVYAQGDEVGARMAFREAYSRIVSEARAARTPHQWLLSEGHDAARRADAVRIADGLGRHVAGAEHLLSLPQPSAVPALLLEGPAVSVPPGARAALQALRERLAAPKGYQPGPDVEARERTAALQAEQLRRVAQYGLERGVVAEEASHAE